MRAELVESKAKRELLEQELHNLLLQLHSSQLSQLPDSLGNRKQDPNFKPDVNNIKKKLEAELRQSPIRNIRSEWRFPRVFASADDHRVNKACKLQLRKISASFRGRHDTCLIKKFY